MSHLSTFIHLDKHLDIVLIHILDKITKWNFHNNLNEGIWPTTKIKFHAEKCHFCHFSEWALKNPWQTLFVNDSYESLEGKTRKGPLF